MKTQTLNMPTGIPTLALTAKSDIAIKVVLFAAILTCINVVAFM